MYGLRGGRYIVAMMMGPSVVLISAAMISGAKFSMILCVIVFLMAIATPSFLKPDLFV